ncbi:MAG: TIM barrel protein [Pseudomonadales bacterium]
MKPISVQLYSLRKESKTDISAVLRELADIGYSGVEPFNLFGKPPREFRQAVEALGMKISSSHFPWANSRPIAEVVDVLGELGLKRAAGGFAPEDFEDEDAIRRTAETTQKLIDDLAPHGLTLFLHNHWWEFALVDGRPGYHLLQELVPDVQFEIDTYWAANFGACDPAEEVARVRARTPLLHIKDGPLEQGKAHVAVGSGSMDIPAVIAAADPEVLEWLVVELDQCDTDMMAAIRDSFIYLTTEKLGHCREQKS